MNVKGYIALREEFIIHQEKQRCTCMSVKEMKPYNVNG